MASPVSEQAILCTRRLRLVPLSDDHLDCLVHLDADPEVMQFVGSGRPRARDEVATKFKDCIARAQPVPGLGLWTGLLITNSSAALKPKPASPEEFVGWWSLQPPIRPYEESRDGCAELGFRLMSKIWRQGFAKEDAIELVRHEFEDLGVKCIYAETMAFINQGSRATMASAGLKYKRTFHLDFGEDTIPGTEFGEVEYDVTCEEWQAKQQGSVEVSSVNAGCSLQISPAWRLLPYLSLEEPKAWEMRCYKPF